MSYITVLLVDGPGAGDKFTIQSELHAIALFDESGNTINRYTLHTFIWAGKAYWIGAIDLQAVDQTRIPKMIYDAQLPPA